MTKKGDKIENIKTVIRRHLQKADVYATGIVVSNRAGRFGYFVIPEAEGEGAIGRYAYHGSSNIRGRQAEGKDQSGFCRR